VERRGVEGGEERKAVEEEEEELRDLLAAGLLPRGECLRGEGGNRG